MQDGSIVFSFMYENPEDGVLDSFYSNIDFTDGTEGNIQTSVINDNSTLRYLATNTFQLDTEGVGLSVGNGVLKINILKTIESIG